MAKSKDMWVNYLDAEGMARLLEDLNRCDLGMYENLHGASVSIQKYRDSETFSVHLSGKQVKALTEKWFKRDLAKRYQPDS